MEGARLWECLISTPPVEFWVEMQNRCAVSACLLVVAITSIVYTTASAQDTSTPEERMQWVEVTHKLESSPLDDSVNKQGEAAFKRMGDVHDFHVLLCPAFLTEFNGMKYTYAHTVTRQYMMRTPKNWDDMPSAISPRLRAARKPWHGW
jgi:hypothetical protein